MTQSHFRHQTYSRSRKRRLRPFIGMVILFICVFLAGGCSRSTPKGELITERYTASETQPSDSLKPSDSAALDSPQAQAAQENFEELCDRLFREQLSDGYLTLHYTLADPESYGIADYDINFGDFSLEHIKESIQKQKEEKQLLAAIDCNLLTDDQKLTYRILEDALEAEDNFEGLELYYQPLAPTVGVQAQLPVLMAEFIFYNEQDIKNYLTFLSTIDTYYTQILEFEQEKAKAGLFMTDTCVDTIVKDCEAYLLAPEHNFLTSTFDERIDAMDGLSDDQKAEYKAQNLEILQNHFIPAYELLLDGLKELKGACTNEQGLCYYPEGKRYYEYLVRSSTGTTYETIDTLHDAIEDQIDSDLMAMSKILAEHEELTNQLADYKFAYQEPGEILEHLKTEISKDFPELEECNYTTKYVPQALEHTLSPAFFLVPPIDRYKDCVIYINRGSVSDSGSLYTTLAHEGYPGHLYQNVYFLSHCTSPLRKILNFNSYSEGWATYVENYSYTTDNGLSPELGQILAYNSSATLGLHALLDININYYGWDRTQVAEYLAKYYAIEDSAVVGEIYSYMLNAPVNYLNYYVGYLEIRHLKELAEAALKDRFELKEFNRFILDIGPAPFTVIEPYCKTWILSYGL